MRDVLLGREPRDLDLVVEGDAAAAARRLGDGAVLHDRFGTATSAGAVNLAAARRERYERPGALPEVELGAPIQDDLARRDFSVNAIAVRLADGALEGYPGALEDLAAHRLRALHEHSFLDVRPACCGLCATPRGCASRSRRRRGRGRSRRSPTGRRPP